MAWAAASGRGRWPMRARRRSITSVSEVLWKVAPSRRSRSRRSLALVKLPLWAMAKTPWAVRAVRGWALMRRLEPVVE